MVFYGMLYVTLKVKIFFSACAKGSVNGAYWKSSLTDQKGHKTVMCQVCCYRAWLKLLAFSVWTLANIPIYLK